MTNRRMHRPSPSRRKTPLQVILNTAAELWAVNATDMMGPSRSGVYSHPRFAFYMVAYEQGWPVQVLGEFLGQRDHKTVVHGIRRARELERGDDDFAAEIEELRELVDPKHGTRPETPKFQYIETIDHIEAEYAAGLRRAYA